MFGFAYIHEYAPYVSHLALSSKERVKDLFIYLFIFQKNTPSISHKILQMRMLYTNPSNIIYVHVTIVKIYFLEV